MNIVMISNYSRPEMFKQSVLSLIENSSDLSKHTLTMVMNGVKNSHSVDLGSLLPNDALIVLGNVGASRARNVGASSIPTYLRHKHVMFVDDDIYAVPGWDVRMDYVKMPRAIVSGHAHPYNHTVIEEFPAWLETNVISTVHMMMPWELWDDVGWFTEPGGAGGSEDVDYCAKAATKGYRLVISKPHCFLHVGLHSSNGTPIVGSELVMERNRELERVHNIVGRVRYA